MSHYISGRYGQKGSIFNKNDCSESLRKEIDGIRSGVFALSENKNIFFLGNFLKWNLGKKEKKVGGIWGETEEKMDL